MRSIKVPKWTGPYIAAATLGISLLPVASKAAYLQRGYQAYGGELLIPILFILIVALAKTMMRKEVE